METPTANSVTMKACVLRADCGELLVRDLSTSQEVRVHTDLQIFCRADRLHRL